MGTRAAVISTEQIDQFLAVPAPGTHGLAVCDARRNVSHWKEELADNIVAEIMGAVLDGFDEDLGLDTNNPTLRMLEVSWFGPTGMTPPVAMPATNENHALIVRRARGLGVPVRYSHFASQQLVQTTQAGQLFGQRPPLPIGRLEREAEVVDTPELFDVSISRTEKPGVVARKIKRKKPELIYFRVRQNHEFTRIDHKRFDEEFVLEVANADLVGIAMPSLYPIAVTTTDAVELPTVAYWHRGDFRGRFFACWAYDRVLRRLGM